MPPREIHLCLNENNRHINTHTSTCKVNHVVFAERMEKEDASDIFLRG